MLATEVSHGTMRELERHRRSRRWRQGYLYAVRAGRSARMKVVDGDCHLRWSRGRIQEGVLLSLRFWALGQEMGC